MRRFEPERLVNMRHDRQYTLEMTARILTMRHDHKISRAAISQWEQGIALPSLNSLAALAELFNVPLDYFFTASTNSLFGMGPNFPPGHAPPDNNEKLKQGRKKAARRR